MKSNNPFSSHGINYLSPSSINTYISDMPLWVMLGICLVLNHPSGAGAVRGIASRVCFS